MSKTITIPYNGDTYTLEFTRKTAQLLGDRGFNIDEIKSRPLTMIPMLFSGAFSAHHKHLSNDTIVAIYDSLGKRSELVTKLIEMYSDSWNTLFDNPDEDEGNPGWVAN